MKQQSTKAGRELNTFPFKNQPVPTPGIGHWAQEQVCVAVELDFRVQVSARIGSVLGAEMRRVAWVLR